MATASISKRRVTHAASKPAPATQPGRFGPWGGRYVPETLMAALEWLEREYERAKRDPRFKARMNELLKTYAGRPTPLFFAQRLTQKLGGAKIYLKREDLLHTGAHKINNCIGQALLVERMGKHRVIAETGAGQHGVATATVCALLGFECVVYMGTEDMRRQELNVFRMRLLGAEERGVAPGVLQGTYSYVLQDKAGQIALTHSVSAGLDYPSIGPEHAMLKDSGRARYVPASDIEALKATTVLARTEGIIPALESAHAVAEAITH